MIHEFIVNAFCVSYGMNLFMAISWAFVVIRVEIVNAIIGLDLQIIGDKNGGG
jgi:hypothetical protein